MSQKPDQHELLGNLVNAFAANYEWSVSYNESIDSLVLNEHWYKQSFRIHKEGADYIDIESTLWVGMPSRDEELDWALLLKQNGKNDAFWGVRFVNGQPFIVCRDIYRFLKSWGMEEMNGVFGARFMSPLEYTISGVVTGHP